MKPKGVVVAVRIVLLFAKTGHGSGLPREEARVVALPHDLALEAFISFTALSIEQGHVDVEAHC